MTTASFRSAVPVWEAGTEKEKNLSLLFTASIPKTDNAILRIAGHSSFVVKINGTFFAAGPARAGHGYYRVDEYPLTPVLTEETNEISILCAGYNVNSFAYLDMPSFLCCEITAEDTVLAATGQAGFTASRYTERIQKVERFSFQRPFAEAYRFGKDVDKGVRCPVNLAETEPKNFITREVYYPEYERVPAADIMERGSISPTAPEEYYKYSAIDDIGPKIGGYPKEELELLLAWKAQEIALTPTDTARVPAEGADLPADRYITYRLPKNLTGFISLTVTAKEDTVIYITFDEVYNGRKVDFLRSCCSNVIRWELAGGRTYHLTANEPYTMQYLNVMVQGGAAEIDTPVMIRYDFPSREIAHAVKMPDAALQAIYDAAVETFRQNTLDIYMDCPSRERAGWLCDSFFTSRTEYELTGRTTVEHAFLDNFLMPDRFAFLPDGMLPMCYPSDHYDGIFIPNWAMWFVLELAEYAERSGDRDLVDRAKTRVYGLLNYFKRFENEDGLLEKLESWVFLEWSHSNDLVQDISYPSNMLYAKVLETVSDLYGDGALKEKAAILKDVIRRQSFLGDFFCDNAVYNEEGKAVLSGEVTESCQYYAFFSGVATPETYPDLWNTLVHEFGPNRRENDKYPHIALSCPFIGNYLRLELLFRHGIYDKVEENIRGFFGYMAEKTGTLWENAGDTASCNHGFASHVVCWLNKICGSTK